MMRVFFFNDPATTEIYTLSLHDALPILRVHDHLVGAGRGTGGEQLGLAAAGCERIRLRRGVAAAEGRVEVRHDTRSEEHTSELQSRQYLVCRLLLEKKKILNSLLIYRVI